MGDVFILRGCTWGGLKGVVDVFTVVGVSLKFVFVVNHFVLSCFKAV